MEPVEATSLAESNKVIELDPERLRVFLDKLSQFERRRIHLKDLWQLFIAAFPHRPREAELRRWLLAALWKATEQNIIELPVENGRRWDRKLHPPLPSSVDRIERAVLPPNDSWRRFPWHPRLAWVADLARITPDQEAFLRQVHDGLVQGLFEQSAPFKYRSLQLTGDEKRLKALTRTVLFGPGRLSLELLGCVCEIPPLVYERVSDQAIAIVFENVEPYRVACDVLTKISNPPYGIVAFGAGRSFEQSIRNFGLIKQPIERIEYVGDLDRPGLHIARAAGQVACRVDLPPVVAARKIHRAMLQAVRQFGHPLGFPYKAKKTAKDDKALVTWLPIDVRPDVLKILSTGHRVPEEVLGYGEMLDVWHQAQ